MPQPASAVAAGWRHFEPLDLTPLLAAALEAFYEHGFHGTTVRDIARRYGQTVPSIYYHHENKEGVFVALLEKGTSDVAGRVLAAAAEGGDRPEARFANVVEAIVLHMTHRTRLAALDSEIRHLSPDVRKRYAARRKEVERVLAGIVEDGVRKREFTASHPAETARAILGMCQAIARWYRPGGGLTPEELAGQYVDIALKTVGAASRPGRC
jgi:AcrR family transcriptional regulator